MYQLPSWLCMHTALGYRDRASISTNHQKCCIHNIEGGKFMVVGRYDIRRGLHPNGPNACLDVPIQNLILTLTEKINNESNPILTKCENVTEQWFILKSFGKWLQCLLLHIFLCFHCFLLMNMKETFSSGKNLPKGSMVSLVQCCRHQWPCLHPLSLWLCQPWPLGKGLCRNSDHAWSSVLAMSWLGHQPDIDKEASWCFPWLCFAQWASAFFPGSFSSQQWRECSTWNLFQTPIVLGWLAMWCGLLI